MANRDEYYTFNEYMKSNTLTPSEEDYIEMIYRLSLSGNSIKVGDISRSLNIKPPSVTKMIKKLDGKKLLNYKKYESVTLTEVGKIVGQRLLYRHNVIRNFLDMIGVKISVHEETEKIEHTISIETLIKIDDLVKFFSMNDDIVDRFIEYKNE